MRNSNGEEKIVWDDFTKVANRRKGAPWTGWTLLFTDGPANLPEDKEGEEDAPTVGDDLGPEDLQNLPAYTFQRSERRLLINEGKKGAQCMNVTQALTSSEILFDRERAQASAAMLASRRTTVVRKPPKRDHGVFRKRQ